MRWADLDPLGHVNNVVYVDYLQEARVDMLRTHGPAAHTGELAEGVVVVRHEVQYVAPLAFRFEPVSIECWVTEVRVASFTMAYEIFQDDPDRPGERLVHLRATTLLTPYVFATERPRRLDAIERETLAEFLEPRERTPRSSASPVRHEKVGHYPVHVRFSDVDVYRHVNNVKYFEYFQEARIQLMVASGRELGQGFHLVVAQTDVDYRRPILFRAEPYDCSTWVSHIGSTSVVFESVVRDADDVLARARVVGVCIDSATGRPAPVPEEFRGMVAAVTPSS